MCGCSRDTHQLGVGRGTDVMTTQMLQYVARFDGGGEIVGFGEGGYKESWPWCSLFVGFPSLGVVAGCTRISSQECVQEM